MKLYYSPGACSLAAHIALQEAGLDATLVRVELDTGRLPSGQDYRAINPMGYVPALRLDDGSVLTETAAVLQYIADRAPDTRLAPPPGTRARYRLAELLNFIATELHKAYSPLFDETLPAACRAHLTRDPRALAQVVSLLADGRWLMGDVFTVADAYLYVMLRHAAHAGLPVAGEPAIAAYLRRAAQRPAVQRALKAEGLIAA